MKKLLQRFFGFTVSDIDETDTRKHFLFFAAKHSARIRTKRTGIIHIIKSSSDLAHCGQKK